MPKAWQRAATSRPMLPRPRMPTVLPHNSSPMTEARSQRCVIWLRVATGSRRAKASITASTCSVIGSAWMPLLSVTMMSRCTTSGWSNWSTPAAVEWIQRRCLACCTASRGTFHPTITSAFSAWRTTRPRSTVCSICACGAASRIIDRWRSATSATTRMRRGSAFMTPSWSPPPRAGGAVRSRGPGRRAAIPPADRSPCPETPGRWR